MKRLILSLVVALSAVITYAQKVHPNISSQKVNVTIDPSVIKGPIKPMNAVNNGPNVAEGTQQIEDFRILNIPCHYINHQKDIPPIYIVLYPIDSCANADFPRFLSGICNEYYKAMAKEPLQNPDHKNSHYNPDPWHQKNRKTYMPTP